VAHCQRPGDLQGWDQFEPVHAWLGVIGMDLRSRAQTARSHAMRPSMYAKRKKPPRQCVNGLRATQRHFEPARMGAPKRRYDVCPRDRHPCCREAGLEAWPVHHLVAIEAPELSLHPAPSKTDVLLVGRDTDEVIAPGTVMLFATAAWASKSVRIDVATAIRARKCGLVGFGTSLGSVAGVRRRRVHRRGVLGPVLTAPVTQLVGGCWVVIPTRGCLGRLHAEHDRRRSSRGPMAADSIRRHVGDPDASRH